MTTTSDDARGATEGSAAPTTGGQGSPSLRGAFRILAVLLGVVAAALIALALVLQLDVVTTGLVNWAGSGLLPWEGARLTAERVSLTGLGRLFVADLRVTWPDGAPLLSVDTLDLRFRSLSLLARRLDVPGVRVAGIGATMRQRADSTWDLLAPFGAADAGQKQESSWEVRAGRVDLVRGAASARYTGAADSVLRIAGVSMTLRDLALGDRTRLTLDTLDALITPATRATPAHLSAQAELAEGRFSTRGITLESDSSDVSIHGELVLASPNAGKWRDADFRVRAAPLDFRDIGALLPGFDVPGSLRFEARVTGDASRIAATADGRTFDGGTLHFEGEGTPRLSGPVRYRLEGRVRDLDTSLWREGAPAGRLDVTLAADLSGDSLAVIGGHAEATVTGLLLGARRVAPTRFVAAFVEGEGRFDVTSGIASLVDIGVTGTARPFDPLPAYDLTATATQQGPYPEEAAVRMAGVTARLHANGAGFTPGKARGRATLSLEGTLNQAQFRDSSIVAEWGARHGTIDLAARAAGGALSGHVEAQWNDDGVIRVAIPVFSARRIDLSEVLGDTVSGRLFADGSVERGRLDRRGVAGKTRLWIEGARWNEFVADSVAATVVVRGGRFEVRGGAAGDGGTLELFGSALPFEETPRWRLDRLIVRDLDLAKIRSDLLASNLGARAEFTGRGTTLRDLTGRGTLALDSSTVGASIVGPGEVELGFDRGHAEVSGNVRALGGSIDVAAGGDPFRATRPFTVERLTFRNVRLAELTSDRVRLPLTGSLTARGTLPPDAVPELEGRLRIEGAPLNEGRLQGLDAEIHLSDGHATVQARVRTGQGTVRADAVADLGRSDSAWTVANARADVALRLPDFARLIGEDSVTGALDADLHLSGSGTRTETMTWQARSTASGRWATARLDSLRLEAGIARGRLSLDTLMIASNVLRGFGRGSVGLLDGAPDSKDTLRIHVVADTARPPSAGTLFGIRPFGIRGAELDLAAFNTEGAIRINGDAALGGLIAGSVGFDTLSLAAQGGVRKGTFRGWKGNLEVERLGLGTLELETFKAEGTWDAGQFTIDADAHRDDGHTLEVAAYGVARERRTFFSSIGVGFGEQVWALTDTASVSWGNRMVFRDLTLRSGNHRIELDGHLDREGTQDLTLRLTDVPVQGFLEFVGIDGLSGTVEGSLALEGPAAAVGLRTALDADVGGVKTRLETTPAQGQLKIALESVDQGDNFFRVNGSVPFTLSIAPDAPRRRAGASERLALDITAKAFPIAWLEPLVKPFGIESFEGRIDSDAHLSGTVGSPEASGHAGIVRGRLAVPRQGVDYQQISGGITLAGDRIRVDSLRAEADGSATVQGDIVLDPLDNPRFELKATFHDFRALHNEWTRLGLEGHADLTGTLEKPRVTGSIQLVDTDVFADQVGQGGGARPVELTEEDYAMLESYFGYRRETASVEVDPLARWAMDLDVSMGGDVWLRKRVQPEMRVQLSGSLDVTKAAGDSMNLFGSVEVLPRRSYVKEFGKRFSIENGTITFNGPIGGWRANIKGRYDIPTPDDPSASEVVITLLVTGGIDNLRLVLGSEPTMETSDIVSYLATGRPSASAIQLGGTGGGLGQRGASVALGAVAGVIEQEARERVGLDVVEIRQGGPEGTVLVAGRYVSPTLYVGFQQPLTTRSPDDGLDNPGVGTQVEIEVAALRWLLLNLQGGRAELRGFLRTRIAF